MTGLLETVNDCEKPLTAVTGQIVAAFLSRNPASASDIPDLIRSVHASLKSISTETEGVSPNPKKIAAVSVKDSITPEYLICLEDGMRFRTLKRHLRQKYNMTPEDYRKKWGLPANYPMVAPSYSTKRSNLAKIAGLGTRR